MPRVHWENLSLVSLENEDEAHQTLRNIPPGQYRESAASSGAPKCDDRSRAGILTAPSGRVKARCCRLE